MRHFGCLPDFMATCVSLSGREPPPQLQCEGRSLLPVLRGGDKPIHADPVFFEHEGNAAVRHGSWKLVREYQKPWELYNLAEDRTELRDLAASEPQRRDELVSRWERWAKANQVAFPERFNMYEFLRKAKAAAPPKRQPAKASGRGGR